MTHKNNLWKMRISARKGVDGLEYTCPTCDTCFRDTGTPLWSFGGGMVCGFMLGVYVFWAFLSYVR